MDQVVVLIPSGNEGDYYRATLTDSPNNDGNLFWFETFDMANIFLQAPPIEDLYDSDYYNPFYYRDFDKSKLKIMETDL